MGCKKIVTRWCFETYTLPPIVMVQLKMGVSPIEVTFQTQPFYTSMIMGESVFFFEKPLLGER